MGINSNAFPTWIDTNGALWVKGFQPAQQLDDGSTRRWRSVTAMANPNGNLAISEYSVVAIDDQGFIWGSGPKVGTTIGTFVRLTQSGGWVEFMGGAVMSPMAVKKANGIIYKSQDYAYYNNLTTVTELEFSLALRYFPSSLGETLLSTNQVVYDSGATTIIVDGVI